MNYLIFHVLVFVLLWGFFGRFIVSTPNVMLITTC